MTETKGNENRRAFTKGLAEVKVKDAQAVRSEIMAILGVTSLQMFRKYSRGRVQSFDIAKYEAVGKVFRKYGVRDPWGL